ncbi:TolC family protein [bacterium]|nr:TolC family protein [bacterium]
MPEHPCRMDAHGVCGDKTARKFHGFPALLLVAVGVMFLSAPVSAEDEPISEEAAVSIEADVLVDEAEQAESADEPLDELPGIIIEAADPSERSEPTLMAVLAQGSPDNGRATLETHVDPQTGEHPVYKLRPVPFNDGSTQVVTLDDLLYLALENNSALQQQGYSIEKGHYSVDQTYYAYDPTLAAGLNYSRRAGGSREVDDGQGGTVLISGTTSNSVAASFDYTLPRENGDRFSLGYSLTGSRQSGGSLSGRQENFSSGITLGFTRPLGRGAGKHLGRIPRYIASNNLQLSYQQLDDQTRSLKRNILDTYYQAVTARQAIDVRQRNIETALRQLERAVERYKVGLGIQADVLQAENNVLNQRTNLLNSVKSYQDLLDTLTTLVGLPQEYELALDTGEALLDRSAVLPEDLWALVLSNSFELKSLNTQLANLRLQREQLEDQVKPQIGLNVSYGRSGDEESFGSAVSSLSNDSIQLGLNWQATKGERSAKASIAQNQLDLASLELEMQQTELELKGRVRERQRDLETKADQIGLAESNLAVTQQAYEIAVERNNVGLATTLEVIEAQEDVLAAELAVLNARVAYHQTYRELLLLAGVI